MSVELADGSKKEIYFDITDFYGGDKEGLFRALIIY
jgi:hypothetical protein